ncbi:hypothetical protein DL766_010568 [Monosporascus sp. MC13-8B]|uniref:G-protein coupled receptors family 2 profile 2 domain-containing protein n=1 Tax=Monosporascus cannonballus TaxID=155416 RepID=A0ABY0H8T4_9PEZI|nr:hypothetical protein DL762_005592 [Monosporascus cannonballus]RYP00152.1 hypothetical protein DL763_001081 [Monosporascus cannonballus]RYP02075.1 hypothetical protein DL766_010568 [Monosporascus sp. MC13-8B]
MAVNVYMTFYFKYDAEKLRRLEVWYFILCYGVPFIPALTFIFIANESQGRMYGNATLWCWISPEWEIFRIALFYGPVWVSILITFFIYIRAGGDIYKKRRQMRYFSSSHDRSETLTMDDPYSIKTTEVTVTCETVGEDTRGIGFASLEQGISTRASLEQRKPVCSVTISADARASQGLANASKSGGSGLPLPARSARIKRRANYQANSAAWSYTKCAILFFTALLITWIPSSANRVYSVINVGNVSPPLEYLSATVLPLQGFWNTVIYISTSWTTTKTMFSDIFRHLTPRQGTSQFVPDSEDKRNRRFNISRLGTRKDDGGESMTELADRRPSSNGDGSSEDHTRQGA